MTISDNQLLKPEINDISCHKCDGRQIFDAHTKTPDLGRSGVFRIMKRESLRKTRDQATRTGCQPSCRLAFRNIRSHGLSSGQSAGAQLRLAVRGVRSGCGIRIVALPSVEASPAIASWEPFGLAG